MIKTKVFFGGPAFTQQIVNRLIFGFGLILVMLAFLLLNFQPRW